MKKLLSAITILSLSIGLLGCGKNLSLSANTLDWMPGGKTDDL